MVQSAYEAYYGRVVQGLEPVESCLGVGQDLYAKLSIWWSPTSTNRQMLMLIITYSSHIFFCAKFFFLLLLLNRVEKRLPAIYREFDEWAALVNDYVKQKFHEVLYKFVEWNTDFVNKFEQFVNVVARWVFSW